MKKKVYFAIAHKSVEDYIAKQLEDEIEVIGSAVYREGVLEAVRREEPDILIIRETLPGSIDFLEIIDTIRVECQKHIQIIVMTGGRQPGDEFLSALVRYSVFDLVVGDNINIKEVCRLVKKPNVWKDVSMYAPKVKIDEKTKKQIFEAPNLPKVVEKEVIREVIIDNTDIVNDEVLKKNAQELEKIEQEKLQLKNEQERILLEKEMINKEKEKISLEKQNIQKEYEDRQAEFERNMEAKIKSIENEKDNLIRIEKQKIENELAVRMAEIKKLELEAEKIIDEEKRKINEAKQLEMEKNIEILRLENEQKINALEQEAYNKVKIEQEKYTQNQIDEIEKFKAEKLQLEQKYLALKEKEESDRLKRDEESLTMKKEIDMLKEKQAQLESQREEDLKALESARMQLMEEKKNNDTAKQKAELRFEELEISLKEKEEELNQEREILAVKYNSLENSLFAEFNSKKALIEEKSKKKLESSRVALKTEMQKLLDQEKQKLLSTTGVSREELERQFVLKQRQISEMYQSKLKDLIAMIKQETVAMLTALEKELLSKKEEEESKLSKEKLDLDAEKENLSKQKLEFMKNKDEMIKSIEEEKEKIEQEHKLFEDNLKKKIAEQEANLESERVVLKAKEEELNNKIQSLEEEQERIINQKIEAIRMENDEKEKELEREKLRLIEEQKSFERNRIELAKKSKEEDEYIKQQLAKLEEEKKIVSKMKDEAKNASLNSTTTMSRNVITFLGCKSGVGTTTVAFNTAIELASNGNKVLYIELNKEFSGISYAYKLGYYDSGLDFAMEQMQQNNYENIPKNIVSIKEVQKTISSDDIMHKSYKKMPQNLEYLFFSGKFYTGDKKYCEKSFKDLMVFILMKLNYDYIIFDINIETKMGESSSESVIDAVTDSILKFSSKIYFVVTQDIASVGACIQTRKLMKKSSVPVNEFRFILNRFDSKAKLNKKGLEDWLKTDINLVLPDKHREVIDSNYLGLPLVIYSKDKEVKKFYKAMETDILGRGANSSNNKKRNSWG